jgi:hypothetical protein
MLAEGLLIGGVTDCPAMLIGSDTAGVAVLVAAGTMECGVTVPLDCDEALLLL